ncbi:MAG: hypothetical protein WBA68_09210 [Alteraurantiacibacter sp.]
MKLLYRFLLSLAARLAPPARAEWFDAVRCEAEHLPESQRNRFALGCLVAALRSRVSSGDFIRMGARHLLVGGALGWAALNLWFAGRMSTGAEASPGWLAYSMATLFAFGAAATARFGLRATIGLGAPLALCVTLAVIVIRSLGETTPLATLHVALLVEDLFVLLVALAIAFTAPRIAERAAWK